jgi:biotin operon repressor
MVKLTEAQVREIKATPKKYGSGKELAERFGVSRSQVCVIRKGRAWKHV